MATEIINNISGKEFYEIVLGEDTTINSEERLEEQFGNLYKHLTNNIWCAKTKYKGSRSANDGLFKIELESGEEIYVLQECKLSNKDYKKAICQVCVYYNMEPDEIKDKIKYFVIITPNSYDIIPVSTLKPQLDKIKIIMDNFNITPCKAYENQLIFRLIFFEAEYEGVIHFNWRTLEDMGDIIKALIA